MRSVALYDPAKPFAAAPVTRRKLAGRPAVRSLYSRPPGLACISDRYALVPFAALPVGSSETSCCQVIGCYVNAEVRLPEHPRACSRRATAM